MSDVATHSPIESPTQTSSSRRLWARLRSVPWGVWLLVFVIGSNIIGFATRMSDPRQWVAVTNDLVLGQPVIWWMVLVMGGLFHGLNLLGLHRRHPLLRQLWMVLPMFSVVSSLAVVLINGAVTQEWPADPRWFDPVATGFVVALFIGLHTRATRRWFGLECLACGSPRVGAANLIYSRLRCKACKHRWHRSEVKAINPAVFD